MKILFLQDDFPPFSFGGAGISVYELALSLKKLGHEIFVITTTRNREKLEEHAHNGLKVITIASNYHERWRAYISINNPPVVKEVERIIKSIKPDVVHANNIHAHISYKCLKVAKRYSSTVIFTARDVMTFNYAKLDTRKYLEKLDSHTNWFDHIMQAHKRWNPLRNLLIRHYLKYVDKVVAISKSLGYALVRNGIENVSVIYNGIDSSEWIVSEDRTEKFKNKNKLLGRKVILFSGRLSAQKGGGKAIEALSLIVKKVPEVVLLVASVFDEYAKAMHKLAERNGTSKNLIFTGWLERDEIKLAYNAADVVLMPSICLDAFGRVNIEAMVSKKPIVSTCYGGSPEIVVDGVTGYIVNPLYPEQISERVSELLLDPEKAKKFGENGYNRAIKYFNLKDKAEEYITLYQELLDKNKA